MFLSRVDRGMEGPLGGACSGVVALCMGEGRKTVRPPAWSVPSRSTEWSSCYYRLGPTPLSSKNYYILPSQRSVARRWSFLSNLTGMDNCSMQDLLIPGSFGHNTNKIILIVIVQEMDKIFKEFLSN